MRQLLVVLALLFAVACTPEPTIEIAGEILVGKHDANVIAFLGVPYAEPPVGDLRWREPQVLATRMVRRDATQFAPACMQTMRILDWYRYIAETFGGSRDYYPDLDVSEDCLYLNVWTPTLDEDANLPVMVWLHGGSNISGWSYERNYHGQALADQGVVVVSVGFRVGLFGFMSHPDLDPSGPVSNFGLWDIIGALRWIQANIDRFGGDPGRVTLLGESSGAHSVVMLMAADAARGLFHRAIGQSTGGYGLEMSTLADVQRQGTDLAAAMGFDGDEALKKLRAASAQKLLTRYVEDVSRGYQNPTLDGVLFGKNPWESFTAGEFRNIPLIIGTNADEWWDFIDPDSTADDVISAANELSYIDPHVALQAVANETLPREALDRLKNAEGYVCPSQALARSMTAAGYDAWMYYFTRIREDEGGEMIRAYHGAEYPYVFNTHDPFMRTTDTDVALTRAIQQYWISFATTGDPNSHATPRWPRFAAPDFPVMELGDYVRLAGAPEPELCGAFSGATAEN
jgi:para-nitrobenzyl esterase